MLLDGGEEVRPAEASVAGQLIVEKIGRLQTSQYLFKAGETLGFSAARPVELVPKKINFFFDFVDINYGILLASPSFCVSQIIQLCAYNIPWNYARVRLSQRDRSAVQYYTEIK